MFGFAFSNAAVMPARSDALYPACCWKRLLSVTFPLPELSLEPDEELELPQAARYSAALLLAPTLMNLRRVRLRSCDLRSWGCDGSWPILSSSTASGAQLFVRSLPERTYSPYSWASSA